MAAKTMTGLPGTLLPAEAPQPKKDPADQPLPPLREDLVLHAGPSGRDGAPTWVIEDPARDRFFQIGRFEAEVLRRWGLGTARAIAESISRETLMHAEPKDVLRGAEFFLKMGLAGGAADPKTTERLKREVQAKGKTPFWKFLLHHYLFFRIPLVNPDKFLEKTLPLVEGIFFTRTFLIATLIALAAGLYLVSRQWDAFTHTFLHFFSLEGAALAGITLLATKVIHELGHAYTAKRFGCHVTSMGVAFMVMMPLLFTDTSGAWKLRKERERLSVVSAGVLSELTVAAWATFAWSFLPDGGLRSAAFMVATTTWVMTLLINMSPFMRFAGYYFLSDLLGVANLHQRSFALARWKMRRFLLGAKEPLPEYFPPDLSRTLVLYAWATWIYRFFLFLGIAALVYHAFFKALGIFLFCVEVGVFLLFPILRELWAWAKLYWSRNVTKRSIILPAAVLLIIGIGLVPWRGSVTVPAVIRPAGMTTIYAPVGAQVKAINARKGGEVRKGALLYELASPKLMNEVERLESEVALLSWQESFMRVNRETGGEARVAERTKRATLARLSEARNRAAKLQVRAPVDGRIIYAEDPLSPGEWVSEGEKLAVIAEGHLEAVGYLSERDLGRIEPGASARFVAENGLESPLKLVVTDIAATATRHLGEVPELASPMGGGIAARDAPPDILRTVDERDRSAGRVWVPDEALYQVKLAPGDDAAEISAEAVLRGTVVIEGRPESLLGRFLSYGFSVLLRESGF